MLRTAQHDNNVSVYISGLSCHPQTLNGPHQESSVQKEEAVGLEPYIRYDPFFPRLPSIIAQILHSIGYRATHPRCRLSMWPDRAVEEPMFEADNTARRSSQDQ